jgi:transcriptional regulator with XRE-family HTH domain
MVYYWWSRYGDFPPGMHNLPHMGKVISYYRQKRYSTQDAFAIACGVEKRTVQEWETAIMTNDTGRRVFLAKMLKIPVALLGLDWHQVADDPHGEHSLSSIAEFLEEDAFYAYEDILVMGHEYIHNGGPLSIADRIGRRLRKLEMITKNARSSDKEAWKMLLCQFYQLSTRVKSQVLFDKPSALKHTRLAVRLATELNDAELLAASHVHAACTYYQQQNTEDAQTAIAQARQYLEKIPNSALKGNIYLESANINTLMGPLDPPMQAQCQKWQDSAAMMLYKGKLEPDVSFMRFNLAAVNHEKAKVLFRFGIQDGKIRSGDANTVRNKLKAASSALPPDLSVWQVYFSVTEAQLYRAERDIEGCVHTAKSALSLARAMHSKMEEEEIKGLYAHLVQSGIKSPYVDNLGVELGIFPQ